MFMKVNEELRIRTDKLKFCFYFCILLQSSQAEGTGRSSFSDSQARHPGHAQYTVRKDTFRSWPHSAPRITEKLIRAGFYFTGIRII